MTIKTVEINISGIVQGVGFRPFLFNLAREHSLNGYVLNRGNAGVRLVVQGDIQEIQDFINNIKEKKPAISYIEKIATKEIATKKECKDLAIRKSEQGRGISLTLPPDVAICDVCLKDMRDKALPRYYQYPFIACAQCGPRFTTVTSLPYDRERSTMINFPFCDSCLNEYQDFDNRRFHAQTFACSICGPNYSLYNDSGTLLQDSNISEILKSTAEKITNGEIAAIKGIGGVHLVCLATDEDVINKLRKRKRKRKSKPFALMVPDLSIIEEYMKINVKERELLESFRRPIVLLEKKEDFQHTSISNLIAPGLNNIGFMLPYTGIHYLLFDYIGNIPLIYTSGNRSNIPMGIENEKIVSQLKGIADVYLLHDRIIYQRADDSVLRVHDIAPKLIRRSRGYVPEYISLPFRVDLTGAIATGPELNVTGAVLRRNRMFPTQHIGNTTNLETFQFLKKAISHMKQLLQIKDSELRFIACDAHPAFITSQYGKELSENYSVSLYPVQHHFSHIVGLMAENNVKKEEEVIGISTDGVGFGDDGNIWGGEILRCSYENYTRLGHLEYQPMIGGDRCTKYPARMAASIILKNLRVEESRNIFNQLHLEKDLEYKKTELDTLISQFTKASSSLPSENIPLSSSTGRVFDAVSYLLGACSLKTYRGEPAMRLEGLASKGTPHEIDLSVSTYEEKGVTIINTSQVIIDILEIMQEGNHRKADMASCFQILMGKAFAKVAVEKAKRLGIKKVGLSGGVAYNYSFSKTIKSYVRKEGLQFLEHRLIPPGDAGISIGQLIGGLFSYLQDQ
ncbi:MAG: putative carbamoyltransferase HypF [Promethearchaeota archaeon]|nr:MAG: putative carbamoyltransferase HypF [Candidatus Lokiarchaeota archaeon]